MTNWPVLTPEHAVSLHALEDLKIPTPRQAFQYGNFVDVGGWWSNGHVLFHAGSVSPEFWQSCSKVLPDPSRSPFVREKAIREQWERHSGLATVDLCPAGWEPRSSGEDVSKQHHKGASPQLYLTRCNVDTRIYMVSAKYFVCLRKATGFDQLRGSDEKPDCGLVGWKDGQPVVIIMALNPKFIFGE